MKTAFRNSQPAARIPVFLLLLGLTLAACGQRGPLYLPESDSSPEPASGQAPSGTPEDGTSEEEDAEENPDG